ncbi:TonB family protein [Hymenobacter sp. BT188]|uniref:TonB family protein n=1 Tax=Hymenobacter sp. BT188 TaxID=2763504 RepID=UPI0016510E86|nr:TonB family protein [Hymenobacter sp. BT188]MBC6608234.1 TonB family protein [Hymenobacter sp. BT188]
MPPEPGGHLPVALLRQYVAGTPAPADQHRVEAHTLDCQRCAEVLEGLEMADAATTDHSLTDLQSRLRTRVAPDISRKSAADWPWLQMASVVLLLIASIVGWRLNQSKTEAQSEPVATVMRREEIEAQQKTMTPPAPQPEVEAMESKPMPAEIVAADASEPELTRLVPSRAVASAQLRAAGRTRSARMAESVNAGIAAIRTESSDRKDKVVSDSTSTPNLAGAAEAPTVASASAPLPPDRARTSLARATAPTAAPPADSGQQVAKMPPSSDARSLASNAPGSSMSMVRGRITDQRSGEGLPGVTVLVKGTQQGVSTQADGSFALPVTDSQSTLTIASIGYQTREYKLTNPSAPLTLALASDTRSLSEVVVTRKGKMPAPPTVGPAPAGGLPAFHEYLKEELKYPEKALRDRTQGTVKLRFTVTASGAIEDLKVVSSLSKECDEEAMRLVREGPAWFPGIIGGRRTAQQVRITVPFRL